jgi:hypothetical protein
MSNSVWCAFFISMVAPENKLEDHCFFWFKNVKLFNRAEMPLSGTVTVVIEVG